MLHSWEELQASDLRGGDDVNIVVGRPKDEDLLDPLFGPLRKEERIYLAPRHLLWHKLLAKLRCYPSASQAAKNLKSQGRSLEITEGCHFFRVGKARPINIAVWKPTPEELHEQEREAETQG